MTKPITQSLIFQSLILMLLALSLSCVSCEQDNETPQPQTSVPAVVAYPPGEYVAKDRLMAAVDADTFLLAAKAFNRKDMNSLGVLKDEGRVFLLAKNTRIALLPADAQLPTAVETTIDGIDVCNATVESGQYIGTNVALPCQGVSEAKN